MQTAKMELSDGYRKELPYKRKLLFITDHDNPKNQEIRNAIKQALDNVVDSVEYKEIDIDKHPNVAKKLGLKIMKQYQVKNQELVETEPALPLPCIAFLEDDIPVWQHSGITRPYTIWAAMTRKPVYAQPAGDVVPVNLF